MDNTENNKELNEETTDRYRVMVVDDSSFIRGAIARAIESDPSLYIVSSVSNGDQAIKALRRDPVDVIVLDIEMPIMDGLTALPQLKEVDEAVQIIMASTLTQKNAEISLRAMSLGATDYIPKPSSGREVMGAMDFKHELVSKIKALGALARRMGVRPSPEGSKGRAASVAPVARRELPSSPAPIPRKYPHVAPIKKLAEKISPFISAGAQKKSVVLRKNPIQHPNIIAIGSSTGGPQALFKVIKDMGKDLPQPIVITQHMPASFTAILADHISRQCEVFCSEAREGDTLVAGHYYIAPGDFHMLINSKGPSKVVHLTQDPPENFCRPAVDPMVRSLSKIYGRKLLIVILTGMGQDGTKGSEVAVNNGAAVIAQDETTSVVWGMPGSVAVAGLCSAVLPLAKIGGFVRKTAMGANA